MLQKKSQIAVSFVFFLLISGSSLSGCRTSSNADRSSDQAKVAEGAASVEKSAQTNTNSVNANASGIDKDANSSSLQTIDKVQRDQAIDRYIKGVAKVSDAAEYEQGRKILYGDLDGDGDEDAVAQFTVEGMGGGNNYGFWLAVFRNDGGKFSGVTDEVVGGKMNRNVELEKIEGGKIYLDTTSYDGDDGACCPSIEGKTSYILQGKKLVENKIK